MANIQQQCEKFHDIIRADYDMNGTLREKRDNILDVLRKKLKENGKPSFRELMQGSYAYGVGIQPIESLEFDIDVGLRFDVDPNTNSAEEVRGWVYDAVKDHTNKVDSKGPCIRVSYTAGYHVDLVAYSTQTVAGNEVFRLAHKKDGWRPPILPLCWTTSGLHERALKEPKTPRLKRTSCDVSCGI